MSDTIHEPLFKPIEVDIEERSARVMIPDVLESIGSPIKSPATGQVHRVASTFPTVSSSSSLR